MYPVASLPSVAVVEDGPVAGYRLPVLVDRLDGDARGPGRGGGARRRGGGGRRGGGAGCYRAGGSGLRPAVCAAIDRELSWSGQLSIWRRVGGAPADTPSRPVAEGARAVAVRLDSVGPAVVQGIGGGCVTGPDYPAVLVVEDGPVAGYAVPDGILAVDGQRRPTRRSRSDTRYSWTTSNWRRMRGRRWN